MTPKLIGAGNTRMLRTAFLAVALPASIGTSARAQGIDLSHGGPINITARNGIEWLQQQHEVIAEGEATAVRQNVTVNADRLIAFYRKKAGPDGKSLPAISTKPAANGNSGQAITSDDDTSGNEIYRLEAEGHVVIYTATDRVVGDKAVYDLDRAVLVITGRNLKLTTPNDVLTARDDLEYWSQQHMAVARGDAVVTTKDARRIRADVLVAYTTESPQQPQPAKPTKAAASATAKDDPLAATGKLEKVEAFGHVTIRTPTETVTGARGVYVPATGIALLVGHVHITRGQNQLDGSEAEVNLKTGISRLLSGRTGRVQGLIVPNEAQGHVPATPPAAPKGTRP